MLKVLMTTEWLETDGLGGYGIGTSDLIPTRRYHALYITPDERSERRSVLLHLPIVEIQINDTWHNLSSFRFHDGTIHPDGCEKIRSFSLNPWPRWVFKINELEVVYEFLLLTNQRAGFLRWTINKPSKSPVALRIRPFLSLRNHHHLQRRGNASEYAMNISADNYSWGHEQRSANVFFQTKAEYIPSPLWYDNFYYQEEANRGYDSGEDLFAPGYFLFQDVTKPVSIKFSPYGLRNKAQGKDIERTFNQEIAAEAKYRSGLIPIQRKAATDFLVKRNGRATVIAGYPWFSDWGRDTFISIRGLCFALGNFTTAKEIIFSWSQTVKDGLIPNRFPDDANEAEYNSIDATLWYLITIGELLGYEKKGKLSLSTKERKAIIATALDIINSLSTGTRYQIHLDQDGLLFAGEPGKQLTWMDAKIADWVVTPRIGKPVEVQALWINALRLFAPYAKKLADTAQRAQASFIDKFWLSDLGYLADVVDPDNKNGEADISLRPNQLFAIGALPYQLVNKEIAKKILKKVEHDLLTPYGLRTLSPSDTRYHGHYSGDTRSRDASYHQGTVWPWLIGAYVDGLIYAHGLNFRTRSLIRQQVLSQLERYASEHGGHLPEICDGDRPHHAKGAPFQAWSLAEFIRVSAKVKPYERGIIAWLIKHVF